MAGKLSSPSHQAAPALQLLKEQEQKLREEAEAREQARLEEARKREQQFQTELKSDIIA